MKQPDKNQILKFELTVETVNIILGALQEIPGKLCNPITELLKQQAHPQLNPPEPELKRVSSEPIREDTGENL